MEPLRVIQGNTKPYEAFWTIRDASQAESGETEVEFFGPISEYSWWGDEVTPKLFKDELYTKGKGKPVTVKVNSPGGEVFAASTIRSILQDYPGRVTADIVGLAASAATIVVTGADVVKIRETAMYMIHDPWTIAMGNADEMRKAAEVLDKVKESLVNAYEIKTGKSRDELAALMSEETWMTAEQALEMGFVDEISEGKPKAKVHGALRAGFLNCLSSLENAPETVREWMNETAEEETENADSPAPGDEGETPGEGGGADSENVTEVEETAQPEATDTEDEIESLRNYVLIFGPKKGA